MTKQLEKQLEAIVAREPSYIQNPFWEQTVWGPSPLSLVSLHEDSIRSVLSDLLTKRFSPVSYVLVAKPISLLYRPHASGTSYMFLLQHKIGECVFEDGDGGYPTQQTWDADHDVLLLLKGDKKGAIRMCGASLAKRISTEGTKKRHTKEGDFFEFPPGTGFITAPYACSDLQWCVELDENHKESNSDFDIETFQRISSNFSTTILDHYKDKARITPKFDLSPRESVKENLIVCAAQGKSDSIIINETKRQSYTKHTERVAIDFTGRVYLGHGNPVSLHARLPADVFTPFYAPSRPDQSPIAIRDALERIVLEGRNL